MPVYKPAILIVIFFGDTVKKFTIQYG